MHHCILNMKVDNHGVDAGCRANSLLVLMDMPLASEFLSHLLIPVLETKVKSFFETLVLGMVIGVMTMTPIGNAYCQSPPEPAVVISIASFNQQMEVVDYLLTSSGFPEMKFMASAMIKGYTRGIDSEKETGVLLYFSEGAQEPDCLAFVPVKNIDEMLDVVAQLAEVEEGDDYATIVTDQGIELMVKEQGGFAFITNKEEIFEELPVSPTQLLGDLPAKYDFSVRVFGQQIPAELRNQALELIKESSQLTLDNLDDQLQAEMQEKNLAMQMKQMEMMFNESDTLTMGIKADQEAKKVVMEVEFTGVPNSELASKIASGAPKQKSRFTGFLMEGATFTQNQNFAISEEDAREYSKMLDELKKTGVSELDQDGDLSDEELEIIEKATGN